MTELVQALVQILGTVSVFGRGLAIPAIAMCVGLARAVTWESRKQENFLIIATCLLAICAILAWNTNAGGLLRIITLGTAFFAYQSMTNSEKDSGKL